MLHNYLTVTVLNNTFRSLGLLGNRLVARLLPFLFLAASVEGPVSTEEPGMSTEGPGVSTEWLGMSLSGKSKAHMVY